MKKVNRFLRGALCLMVAAMLLMGGAIASELSPLLPYGGDTVTYSAFTFDVGVKESEESPGFTVDNDPVGNILLVWAAGPVSVRAPKAAL